jgi:hypothetical protein
MDRNLEQTRCLPTILRIFNPDLKSFFIQSLPYSIFNFYCSLKIPDNKYKFMQILQFGFSIGQIPEFAYHQLLNDFDKIVTIAQQVYFDEESLYFLLEYLTVYSDYLNYQALEYNLNPNKNNSLHLEYLKKFIYDGEFKTTETTFSYQYLEYRKSGLSKEKLIAKMKINGELIKLTSISLIAVFFIFRSEVVFLGLIIILIFLILDRLLIKHSYDLNNRNAKMNLAIITDRLIEMKF